jgi:hypothetical protein
VRRLGAALALAAVLTGACGQSDLSSEAAKDLQQRVAAIRAAAEAGKPVITSMRLRALTSTVASFLDQGLLSDQRAIEIVEAAEDVRTQLSLLPRASSTESPSPSVEEEDHGGKGNGKGKGKGDEGHGNDGD